MVNIALENRFLLLRLDVLSFCFPGLTVRWP